jgi:FKBP-type peptidyl-prolyl cis-trans isomerase 2
MHVVDNKVVSFHFTLTDNRGKHLRALARRRFSPIYHGQGHPIPELEVAAAGKSAAILLIGFVHGSQSITINR